MAELILWHLFYKFATLFYLCSEQLYIPVILYSKNGIAIIYLLNADILRIKKNVFFFIDRYSTLVGTMKKKFTTKRKWAAENGSAKDDDIYIEEVTSSEQRPKFRKPKDA